MTRRAQRLAGSARLLRGADDGAFDRTFWAAIAAFNAAGVSCFVVGAHAIAVR